MDEEYTTRNADAESEPTLEFLPCTPEYVELAGPFVAASASLAANPHEVAIESLG